MAKVMETSTLCIDVTEAKFGSLKVPVPQLKSGSLEITVQNLYELHCKNALYFPAYVTLLSNEELIDLGWKLMELDKDVANSRPLISLISSIINAEILNSPGCHELLDIISQIITDKALQKGGHCSLLNHLTLEAGILPAGLKKLLLNILHRLLSSNNEYDISEFSYLSTALSMQVKFWNRDSALEDGCELFQQISAKLSEEEIFNKMWSLATGTKVSWNVLFQALSVINRSGFPSFKKRVESVLVQSVEGKNKQHVVVALAMMRAICASATEYGAWNASLHSVLPAQSSFMHYIDCLSQIVPLEPTICLKVHINKVPCAPHGSHSVLADYVALVRARLSELNETSDWGGLFGDCNDCSDVERVLAHFQATNGQVMCAVQEAAVFRKDYYERVFLRQLVATATATSDTATANATATSTSSTALQLLHKLHATGKCPTSIYMDCKSKAAG